MFCHRKNLSPTLIGMRNRHNQQKRKSGKVRMFRQTAKEILQLAPRMGQQHHSPGQSLATERREAPPWVLQYTQALP